MKILVTGGAGFIGSAFVRLTIENSLADFVVNYDLLTYAGNLANVKDVENDERYAFVQGDIKDKSKVIETVKKYGIDTILNFAAETHVDRSIENPNIFLETNILGTGVLLDVATELDLRFHQISTDEVYGTLTPTEHPFTEKSNYAPRSPYSASKAGADHLVRAYFNTYGTKVTISNCSNNYGPYHYPEKIIPLFITNLLQGKKVPVYGDGMQIRDWLYVDDHVKAIWKILNSGKIGETYCVGGENEITNLELTKVLLKAFGKDESFIEHVEDRKGHDRRYAIDITKIKNELGWEPEVKFEEGIAKTVEWFKENSEWWEKDK